MKPTIIIHDYTILLFIMHKYNIHAMQYSTQTTYNYNTATLTRTIIIGRGMTLSNPIHQENIDLGTTNDTENHSYSTVCVHVSSSDLVLVEARLVPG